MFTSMLTDMLTEVKHRFIKIVILVKELNNLDPRDP